MLVYLQGGCYGYIQLFLIRHPYRTQFNEYSLKYREGKGFSETGSRKKLQGINEREIRGKEYCVILLTIHNNNQFFGPRTVVKPEVPNNL